MFDIRDFGARAGGQLCTKSIQSAIDKCFLSGGGIVVVPKGEFLTGGLRIRSNVTLHLLSGAVLKASCNPEDYFDFLYDEIEPITEDIRKVADTAMEQAKKSESVHPCSRRNNAIIRAICAENIEIRGEKDSIIDGMDCYDECGEEGYRGPHGINIWYCKNIKLFGYTLKNTGNWAHAIHNSCNIYAEKIRVLGGHDGFDMRSCDNVNLMECEFYTGDDAIAGFDNVDITIRDCILNSSPNSYGFRGTLSDEEKKSRAKTNSDNSRFNCLTAFLYYCDFRAKIRKTPGNIVIKNVVSRMLILCFPCLLDTYGYATDHLKVLRLKIVNFLV